MRLCITLLFMSGLVVADEPAADGQDAKNLQGLWQAVALEANGQKAPAKAVEMFQVQIKEDQLVFSPATDNRKHTFTIDPEAKPKAMDLTPADGPEKGRKLPTAIYKLAGDKLTICLSTKVLRERPTEFKTTPENRFALLTLERVKDKK